MENATAGGGTCTTREGKENIRKSAGNVCTGSGREEKCRERKESQENERAGIVREGRGSEVKGMEVKGMEGKKGKKKGDWKRREGVWNGK